MRRIAAAIAAITLIAGTAHAQGQGGGRGNDRGGGQSAETGQKGGGNGNRGGGQGQAERGNRGQADGPSMARSESRGNGQGNRDDRGSADRGNVNRGNADQGNSRRAERADSDNRGRGNDRAVVIDNRGRGDDRDWDDNRGRDWDDDRDGRDIVRVTGFGSIPPRGLINGCPPGLAKKNPPCVPPGQARRDDWFEWDRPDWWGLRLGDGRYFYDDGYLLRYGPDGRVGGYIPLLGGALAIGNPWPSYYEPVRLPDYYERYYGLGDYNAYRYADNVIYRVDPETAAITSVAALLTGDDFEIGRPMPTGYDIYNVPYGYRDRYADGPDANYRYADGYVYRVDPTTRLIAAAIKLLVS